ncbi:uncharacterized protein [Centruroides vittatus]|uniref:uncharacterized protein n=1 Tax=Centruroides vittatus TaxID=120091 RepID=UPI00350F509E
MSNKRCAILELFWQGKHQCEIVRLLGVPKMTVSDAVQRLKELGHDGDHPGRGRKCTVNTSRNRKIITKRVDRHAKVSMRKIACEIRINRKLVWLMVKKELVLKPYKFQKVQLLTDENKCMRLQRSRQLKHRAAGRQWECILFTDKKLLSIQPSK